LNQAGIAAGAIHGDKSQPARQRALADFKSSRTDVLVATDVAARGIDVEGISHVLNFDLPHEPEMYIHRIGRTGRAGATGVAVSLCDDEEREHLRAIEQLTGRALPVERGSSNGASRIDPDPPQAITENPPKRKRPRQKRFLYSGTKRRTASHR
jgi:ATP-dependent RNA helicase RhlE